MNFKNIIPIVLFLIIIFSFLLYKQYFAISNDTAIIKSMISLEPSIKHMVSSFLDDNKITKYELRKILSEYYKIKNNKNLQEIKESINQ